MATFLVMLAVRNGQQQNISLMLTALIGGFMADGLIVYLISRILT